MWVNATNILGDSPWLHVVMVSGIGKQTQVSNHSLEGVAHGWLFEYKDGCC